MKSFLNFASKMILLSILQNVAVYLIKDFVHYIFARLFCISKRKHLSNKEKCFLFHFNSSFHSGDNRILTFQIFKCHGVIKCLSMNNEIHFIE